MNYVVVGEVTDLVNSGEFADAAAFTDHVVKRGLVSQLGNNYEKLKERVEDPNKNIRSNEQVTDALKLFRRMIVKEDPYEAPKRGELKQAAAFDSWFWNQLEVQAKATGATSPDDKLALALKMVNAHTDNKFYVGEFRHGNPYEGTNVGSFIGEAPDIRTQEKLDKTQIHWGPVHLSTGELQDAPEVPPADEDVLTRLPKETPEELTRRRNRLENDG